MSPHSHDKTGWWPGHRGVTSDYAGVQTDKVPTWACPHSLDSHLCGAICVGRPGNPLLGKRRGAFLLHLLEALWLGAHKLD